MENCWSAFGFAGLAEELEVQCWSALGFAGPMGFAAAGSEGTDCEVVLSEESESEATGFGTEQMYLEYVLEEER